MGSERGKRMAQSSCQLALVFPVVSEASQSLHWDGEPGESENGAGSLRIMEKVWKNHCR